MSSSPRMTLLVVRAVNLFSYWLTKPAGREYQALLITRRPLSAEVSVCGLRSSPWHSLKQSTDRQEPKCSETTWKRRSTTDPQTRQRPNTWSDALANAQGMRSHTRFVTVK